MKKKQILVIGGGFAGAYCAKSLAGRLGRQSLDQVGLIAEQNVMVFQPMLAEVAGSSLSPLDVVNPLRLFCRGVDVLRGRVVEIDLDKRQVTLNAGEYTRNTVIQFDHLVLAAGSVVDLSRVAGMPEHALVMKNVGDALRLRSTIINRLEEASLESDPQILQRLLTFVIVGGGFSGVETAGQILSLVQGAKPFYRELRDAKLRVILLHAGPRLLPEVGEPLGLYAEHQLRRAGMEIVLNARASSMTAHGITVSSGQVIETATVVSTIGNAPNPLLLNLCEKYHLENHKGRIVTERTLQAAGHDCLWAAGDCAAVPDGRGSFCPPLAQYAQRQGVLLAKNLAAILKGKPLRPFAHKYMGQLALIGHRKAVGELLGIRFSGLIAWFIWRTLYLSKLPGLQRKLRVVSDWTMDLFFPRELSLLVSPPTEVLQEVHLRKGEVIFNAGEPARSFYIVKEGRVELTENGSVKRNVKPGEHFGARGLLGDGIWHRTATAVEPTVLVSVDRSSFHVLAESSAAFRQSLEAPSNPDTSPPVKSN